MKCFTPLRGLALLLILSFSGAGCGNPCTELADASCERAGEASATCVALRERTDKVSSADKRDCKLALKSFDDLAPSQR